VSTNRAVIRFGTDGWRALIARDYTFANLERVTQAFADYLSRAQSLTEQLVGVAQISKEEAQNEMFANVIREAASKDSQTVVIGYDCRFMSEHFAKRAAEVMSANGFRVLLFPEAVPTPVVSWAVRDLKSDGGIVITASHNPPDFNGFKIKAPWGGSATPATTAEVEKLVDAHPVKRAEFTDSNSDQLQIAIETYRAQVSAYVDIQQLKHQSATLIVDSMHGSGGKWIESFLSGGELKVETIRSNRDPLFGGVNPEPIDRNLEALKKRVVETGALAGVATDGDADRVGAVNERGETMTMHDVVPMILLHLVRNRHMTGGVVRTFSQSVLLKRIAAANNLKLYETPIGFKYIAELMLNDDILIGAEESGGIGVKNHIPERDGILNALLFLETVIAAHKPPSEILRDLHREFGEFHFDRLDIQMPVERGMKFVTELAADPPALIAGQQVTEVQTLDGTKLIFADESWLLFRQSGTEPVLRIYAEATRRERVRELLETGAQLANK
jgi:phosphomannomutase